MNFSELKDNTIHLFPSGPEDKDGHYEFWIAQALQAFENRPGDLSGVWERIRAYDGNTKRPRLAFFIAIANGAPIEDTTTKFYKCLKCGEKLSFSSAGGCVKCRKSGAIMATSEKPVTVTRCQAPCFDCSIYGKKGHIMGPQCDDFGTPRYTSCGFRSSCECHTCCRFEFMRAYRPEELRKEYPGVLSTLPAPISEAGKAFSDDRASFVDINGMLTHLAKNKRIQP
jgi:hypothetical protein